MDCQQFLTQYSEFLDGRAETGVSREIEAHRSQCDRCEKYADTLEAGRNLLRTLPKLTVTPEFRPRLDHRIIHLEDGVSLARESMGSGATMASVLAVAVLVTLSAWVPAVNSVTPAVELPALVAEPPVAPFTPSPANPTFPRNIPFFTTSEFQDGIWGDSYDLLREYSPISERRRNQALIRVGIE